VLAAIGIFALAMVSRPLLPWKKILIGSMVGFLVLLLVSRTSQEFFELNLPRAVVLLAAIGIVSITGTLMISTLRAVGWIRQVPAYLRENPETVSATWTDLRRRVGDVWSSESEDSLIERYRSWRPQLVDQVDSPPALAEPEPEPPVEPELPAPEDLDTLEWFDTDDFLKK
jgi:hypothetical protein